MALALAAKTVQNITVVTGTVSGGAGGTASLDIFNQPGGTGIGRGGFVERFRIKVLRLIAPNSVAKDFIQLTDQGTITDSNRGFVPDDNTDDATFARNAVWESTLGTGPFEDQTNLGDEFRNGLRITATTAATTNDTNSGYVFRLFLYHGLS